MLLSKPDSPCPRKARPDLLVQGRLTWVPVFKGCSPGWGNGGQPSPESSSASCRQVKLPSHNGQDPSIVRRTFGEKGGPVPGI